jgi:hypothetical protein
MATVKGKSEIVSDGQNTHDAKKEFIVLLLFPESENRFLDSDFNML